MTHRAPENSQKYLFLQVFCCFWGFNLIKLLFYARGGSVRTVRAGAACGRRPPGPFNLHQFLAPGALVCYSVSFAHSFPTFTGVVRPQISQTTTFNIKNSNKTLNTHQSALQCATKPEIPVLRSTGNVIWMYRAPIRKTQSRSDILITINGPFQIFFFLRSGHKV